MERPLAALVLLAPLAFVAAAAFSRTRAPSVSRSVPTGGGGADPAVRVTGLATVVGVLVASAAAVSVAVIGTSTSPTLGAQGLGLAVRLDPLSVIVFAMISVLALIIVRFSTSYLDGEPRRPQFLARLALTIAAVEVLVLSANLVTLVAAWVATSLALHRLLVFHPDRPRAVLAARKKFVAARVGDVLLLAAAVLLYRTAGTGDLQGIFDAVAAQASTSPAVVVAGLCLAVAAMLKSALFPTHGWLVEVMETPTPVSALLHAGVLNAGPFLVLRTSPVLESVGAATTALVLVGGTTAVLASMSRITQPSVKVGLGYSSAGHMGFSLMLCGLGLFPAAALHLVAHSFYKAHAFLSSGSAIDEARAGHVAVPPRLGSPLRLLGATAIAVAIYLPLAALWGVRPDSDPALFVLGGVILLATVQLVAAVIDSDGPPVAWLWVGGLSVLVTSSFFALEGVLHALLHDVVPDASTGTVQLVLGALVVLAGVIVVAHQLRAPTRAATARRDAWRVHLRNGLYANALFDRLVMSIWAPIDRQRSLTVATADDSTRS